MKDDFVVEELRAMGHRPVPPLDDEDRRGHVIDAMVRAASPRRPFPLRRVIAVASVAAALAVAGVGFARWHARPVEVATQSTPDAVGYVHAQGGEVVVIGAAGVNVAPQPDAKGLALKPSDRVATLATGRATVHVGSVAVAAVAPNSELVMGPFGGAACEVKSGSAYFEVAKLPAGERFVVHTAEADVTVHGTAFRVSVETRDGAPHTEVVVTDGVVSVTSGGNESKLGPGDRWPPAVAAPATSVLVAPPSRESAGVAKPDAPVARGEGHAKADAPTSDLAEQNRLLADAAAARSRGDASAEAHALDTFIQRFPRSPGLHDAVANRMRAAARSGDTALAAREARQYLSLFPSGPLRDEAASLAARSPRP